MANRFDTPYGQRYVSQYVPLPFEAIGALGEQLQKKRTSLLKATDDVSKEILSMKADPKNELVKNKLQKVYNDNLLAVSNKIATEGYTPENEMLVNKTINNIVNDPNRMAISNAYNNYQEFLKDSTKLSAEGKWDPKIYDDYKYDPKNLKEDEVTPYVYTGVSPKMDYTKPMRELMDKIKADSGASGKYLRKDGTFKIENGMILNNENKWEKLTDSKVWKIAEANAEPFLSGTLEGKYYIDNALGKKSNSYNDLSNENNFATITNRVPKKDSKGKIYYENVETPISQKEYVKRKAIQDLFNIATPQIFSSYDSKESVHNLSDRALDDIENNNIPDLPTYTNPVKGSPTTSKEKSGLDYLGINTNAVEYNSEKSRFVADPKNATYTLMLNGIPVGKTQSFMEALAHTAKNTFNGGSFSIDKNTSKEKQKDLEEFYTGILNTAKNLNLPLPKNADGKIDYNKLAVDVDMYGRNISKTGTSTQGFVSKVSEDITRGLLGEVIIDKNGDAKFKQAPILETAKLIDMATNKSVDIKDDKINIAEDGYISGIDYTAPTEGTYRVDSKGAAYNLDPGDLTLKKKTENTWNLTQDVMSSREGKYRNGKPTVPILVDKTIKQNGKDVTIASRQEVPLEMYASSKIQNIINNTKNPELKNRLENQLSLIGDKVPVAHNYSDIKQEKGNSPKYEYIVYQGVNLDTYIPEEVVVRINKEQGGLIDVVTLDDVHKEESHEVSSKYLKTAYKHK